LLAIRSDVLLFPQIFRFGTSTEKSMAIVAIVYHSGYGHTKLQAEAVHRGAGSVAGVEARLYTSEEAISKLDELDQADAVILGCPT
jgi:NAD(P)H dehydrogenase (quinone)